MKNIMAVDVGLKRIGIAKCVNNIPLPMSPIFRKNRNQAAKELQDLIIKSDIEVLIVGIPQKNFTAETRIKHFIGLLDLPKGVEICFIDESFSSIEALERIQGSKRDRKKDGTLDSIAALVILERYLVC
ncbi:MAG: Holliday junction resolvase RuvX [Helicobacter sp.]|nr:Holliday junction resolvase RuvX [Helicobacter sp.]